MRGLGLLMFAVVAGCPAGDASVDSGRGRMDLALTRPKRDLVYDTSSYCGGWQPCLAWGTGDDRVPPFPDPDGGVDGGLTRDDGGALILPAGAPDGDAYILTASGCSCGLAYWGALSWNADVPQGTKLSLRARIGGTGGNGPWTRWWDTTPGLLGREGLASGLLQIQIHMESSAGQSPRLKLLALALECSAIPC